MRHKKNILKKPNGYYSYKSMLSTNTYDFPSKGINKKVKDIITNMDNLTGGITVDFPAGDGRTSYLLSQKNNEVRSFDLFPEFFKVKELKCEKADINKGLPIEAESIDFAVCQEGIEHFQDQLKSLQEFSRILKKEGRFLLTTPNISQMKGRLSQFFIESEYYKRSPESEMDGVWFTGDKINQDEMYFGHIFLINIQKLRTLSVFSGMEIEKIYWADISPTSVFLFILLYPLIILFNLFPFIFYYRKNKNISPKVKRRIMKEQFKLNCSPKVLLSKHLIVLFKKKRSKKETVEFLKSLRRTEVSPV